ncbi:FGGY family carbohydrate kinase [Candidatus Solincola tengchongensis]|uniref:xylulokinase n=1 Tax=Candidatus Solincola tengchongensis TaxID=2900693 RepID=UPI00257E6924|nr:FGGY family carbohydrate kinase [Candidatus Solincola tengchongensis]
MSYLLGLDAGSSSIKAALIDVQTGRAVASASSPREEMPISSPRPGWAEQDPLMWWEHLRRAVLLLGREGGVSLDRVEAIGISYQMHGLVVTDASLVPLRPAIIWCDSRAVPVGERAFREVGEERCLARLLNAPGNFTASRMRWLMDNDPETCRRARWMMLPGDWLAARMTGEASTTAPGLSEMILWDFLEDRPAYEIMEAIGIEVRLLPPLVPIFSVQGELRREVAEDLGLRPGIPVSYRAGDQPNNAFSLRVLEPGEAAATAGTSGVVYAVTDRGLHDPESRVNVFLHVNHAPERHRYGILLCVNGTGILYRWLKRNLGGGEGWDYRVMNELASRVPVGSEGLVFLPYGNGAERTLGNRDPGASLHGLDLNLHRREHVLRAAQEGIAFALKYGLEIMEGMGFRLEKVRAGRTNMFLSPVFREAFTALSGVELEIYETDGAQGAARGAGLGAGMYRNAEEAFRGLSGAGGMRVDGDLRDAYLEAYTRWREVLRGELPGLPERRG